MFLYMKHTISIITINYNNAARLRDTIASVVNQDYPHVEYVVIDGGSTDGSVDVIKSNSNSISYWISEKDTGVYNAMNKGIAVATGDYIIFLNSGDVFIDQQVVSKCCQEVKESAQADILYGNILVANPLNEINRPHDHPKNLTLRFFKNDTINHQASLIKRTLFREFGLYPECYKSASDCWLYIISLLANKTYQYLDFQIVIYDFTGMSAVDNFKAYRAEQTQIWEILVPEYAKQLILEVEQLESHVTNYRHTVDYYHHIANYKIVKTAINLNSSFQKFKDKILGSDLMHDDLQNN